MSHLCPHQSLQIICTCHTYVTHMFSFNLVVLHICHIYVQISTYVTYMWTNETYVTYISHVCRFGKGNASLHVTYYRCSKLFIAKQSSL